MLSDAKRLSIENRAQSVISDDNILALPVCPYSIARSRAIEVIAKSECEQGVSGMLLRHGSNFAILFATHIANDGFRRFCIAHELGHYFLDGHPDRVFSMSDQHVSRAGYASEDEVEQEADHFAACLLMPKKLFKAALSRTTDGLTAIEFLSTLCVTSMTATAIRYAELTDAIAAIVVSRENRVEYSFLSRPMRDTRGIRWLRKGSPVPRGTVTFALNREDGKRRLGYRSEATSDFGVWLDGDPNRELFEEAVSLGEYGRTLTVLSSEPIDDDEDESDEWEEPRFARGR